MKDYPLRIIICMLFFWGPFKCGRAAAQLLTVASQLFSCSAADADLPSVQLQFGTGGVAKVWRLDYYKLNNT
jgi:hypothetical protein